MSLLDRLRLSRERWRAYAARLEREVAAYRAGRILFEHFGTKWVPASLWRSTKAKLDSAEEAASIYKRRFDEKAAESQTWAAKAGALAAERDRWKREHEEACRSVSDRRRENDALRKKFAELADSEGNKALRARLRDAEATIESVAVMLGWKNVPPGETLEANLRANRTRLENAEREYARLATEVERYEEANSRAGEILIRAMMAQSLGPDDRAAVASAAGLLSLARLSSHPLPPETKAEAETRRPVAECTREQPHDGPCNGWPCAYVREKLARRTFSHTRGDSPLTPCPECRP